MLVSELNFGAQSRWSAAGAVLPERDRGGPRPLDTVLEPAAPRGRRPGLRGRRRRGDGGRVKIELETN